MIFMSSLFRKIFTVLAVAIFLSSLLFFFFKSDEAKEKATLSPEAPTAISSSSSLRLADLVIPVEIADTEAERRQGLSGRRLAENSGMLFAEPKRHVAVYWMINMLIPLDIVWIDGDQIVKIDKNLPPGGENPKETYSSEQPVDHVLELNAGFSERHGLKVGDRFIFDIKE